VVDAAFGHGEEVATGPGSVGSVQLDQQVADVVPDTARTGVGGEVAAGAGDEGPDRVPAPVGGITCDLEDASGTNSSTSSSKRPPSTWCA